MHDLIGADPATIASVLVEAGVPERQIAMRVKQLRHRMHVQGIDDFAQAIEFPAALRGALSERARVGLLQIVRAQTSNDGTRKWLLRTHDGNLIETVYIPDHDRGTVCISSQVGCTLTCSFCHTGTQRLVRNLSASEIVAQVALARREIGDIGKASDQRRVTNIVLMGMGEPLYNFDAVKQAVAVLADGEGIAIGKRRITLSTSGVVPMMARAGAEIDCNLAVSLHAVNDETRNLLVPLNKKYPLAQLMEACRTYPGASNARRITFEYVMLDGVNDSDADAFALVRLLRDLPAKVNLIPFNPWPGSQYRSSPRERIAAFADIIMRAGYASPVRVPRGRDIAAACGQLKSESMKAFKSAAH